MVFIGCIAGKHNSKGYHNNGKKYSVFIWYSAITVYYNQRTLKNWKFELEICRD